MSYVEYDPTNPEVFENFVSKRQKQKKLIKGIVITAITCFVIYLIFKKPDIDDEEDFVVS